MCSLQRANFATVRGATLVLEVADTKQKKTNGLMHRTFLESNRGMLFPYEKEEKRSFWMKHTSLPLDIIFVNGENIVTNIGEGVPHSLESVSGEGCYIIETNQGWVGEHGIRAGDTIAFS
jgi:uncharacterized protein